MFTHHGICHIINCRCYLLGPHVRIACCKQSCHLQLTAQLLCNSIMTAAIDMSCRSDSTRRMLSTYTIYMYSGIQMGLPLKHMHTCRERKEMLQSQWSREVRYIQRRAINRWRFAVAEGRRLRHACNQIQQHSMTRCMWHAFAEWRGAARRQRICQQIVNKALDRCFIQPPKQLKRVQLDASKNV